MLREVRSRATGPWVVVSRLRGDARAQAGLPALLERMRDREVPGASIVHPPRLHARLQRARPLLRHVQHDAGAVRRRLPQGPRSNLRQALRQRLRAARGMHRGRGLGRYLPQSRRRGGVPSSPEERVRLLPRPAARGRVRPAPTASPEAEAKAARTPPGRLGGRCVDDRGAARPTGPRPSTARPRPMPEPGREPGRPRGPRSSSCAPRVPLSTAESCRSLFSARRPPGEYRPVPLGPVTLGVTPNHAGAVRDWSLGPSAVESRGV